MHDRQVCWRIALLFAAPAAAGSLLGTLGNHAADERVMILTFVPVMLIAAAATWHRASGDREHDPAGCPPPAPGRTTLAGVGVGALTGFFGVGGGFLIVPALTIWLGVGLRHAVGTSLVVITLTAAAALTSHLLAGATLDLPLTATLATATATGALAGTAVAGRLPQHTLAQAFALLVLAVAVLLLVDTLLLGGPPKQPDRSTQTAATTPPDAPPTPLATGRARARGERGRLDPRARRRYQLRLPVPRPTQTPPTAATTLGSPPT